jgi:CheY-like chemotaxis protein
VKTILYAEDREDDVFFVRRACRRVGLEPFLCIASVRDGQAAVDYLAGVGPYADRERHPLPDLVLLDLKMPHRSGLEVLDWIRRTPPHTELPVFILTSSNQELDMQRASALRANGYIIKPGGIGDLASRLEEIAGVTGVTSREAAAGRPSA